MKNIMKGAFALVLGLVIALSVSETTVVYAAPSHNTVENSYTGLLFSKKHAHIFNRAVTEKWTEATCDSYATQTWACSQYVTKNGKKVLCEEEVTIVTGNKLAHNYVSTATEQHEGVYQCVCGDVEEVLCKNCKGNKLLGLIHIPHTVVKVAPKLEHSHVVVEDAAVDATCTTSGLTAGSHCATCGEVFVEQQVIAAEEHDWYVIKEVTHCDDKGVRHFKCTAKCGATKEEVLAPTGHTYITIAAKAPTCTEAGHYEYEYCTTCNDSTYYLNIIPATGHEWYVSGEQISCTLPGERNYKCKAGCGATMCEELAPTGHTMVTVAEKKATCKEDGHNEYELCSTCGWYDGNQYVVYGKTAHKCVEIGTIAPTCTENGYTGAWGCDGCGLVAIYPSIIPATGHESVYVNVNHSGNATDFGTADEVCKHCNETIATGVKICYHAIKPSDCKEWCKDQDEK